jgi:hypothetical protein
MILSLTLKLMLDFNDLGVIWQSIVCSIYGQFHGKRAQCKNLKKYNNFFMVGYFPKIFYETLVNDTVYVFRKYK